MRDHNPELERRFFDVFRGYYDLETSTARKYSPTEYTLDRMVPLSRLAGNPERGLRVVHVAGTKGKGSTCHYVTALLAAAGRRTGLFTSPHLATVRERFRIDNELLPYDVITDSAVRYEEALRRSGLNPGLFEILTVLALRLFADAGCEFAVMETGIGGRLDATNYIPDPACCAITSISMDHMQLLGNTVTEIAAEKAGIIKPGIPVVCAKQPFPEALEVIRARAAAVGAPCYETGAAVPDGFAPGNLPPYERENLAAALKVAEILGLTPDPTTFRMPELRARCEVVRTDPPVILDAAHNRDSARRLTEALGVLYPGVRFTVVLGVVPGKDAPGIFRELLPVAREFILTHPRTPKGSVLDELAALARAAGAPYRRVECLNSLECLPPGEPLLFTGSFFTAVLGEDLFN